MSKMSEKVATGVLSGVLKVSGYLTSSVVNSKAGKKFFNLLPGEVVLASMDGFGKVCDAVEVAGRNVMSTTSVVTTGLVSHRHGEKAAEATHEGLDAAGHAAGLLLLFLRYVKRSTQRESLNLVHLPNLLLKLLPKVLLNRRNSCDGFSEFEIGAHFSVPAEGMNAIERANELRRYSVPCMLQSLEVGSKN